MDMIAKSYRGLHLLWDLNWDRVLYLATITVALLRVRGLAASCSRAALGPYIY